MKDIPDWQQQTFVDILRYRAHTTPDQIIYTFILNHHDRKHLTYAAVDRQARMIGALLQRFSTPGARVLLLYPPGLEYITAFFGCLYAGAVAIPAYPPNPARLARTLPRLQAIVQDACPTIALTTEALYHSAAILSQQIPAFRQVHWYATDTPACYQFDEWTPPLLDTNTLAFLQYTSGSTATPKGVMVSHGNLLANSTMIAHCFGHAPTSRGVIWLPPYHDMGLIGGILQPLFAGVPVTLMSPVSFLQHPFRWLQAIAETRATSSGGPNFAYDLCVRKITPEERATLDLQSWELAFNGAEPVRADTLDRFAEAFQACGFRREAFYPCYGLAEATLIVSGGQKDVAPLVTHVQSAALSHHQVVLDHTVTPTQTLVSSGHPAHEQHVIIVDQETLHACPSGQIGEIWVAGPSIAQGYWNHPDATQQTFGAYLRDSGDGPFLRTGDLGFLADGELFVTGRIKDLIIIRGRNYYPHDIECTAEQSHAALRPGSGAAFSVEIAGEEQLVVIYELDRHYHTGHAEIVVRAIRQAIVQNHELAVYAVVLLKPGSIPKTSSGKIQRWLCREAYCTQTLSALHESCLTTHYDLQPSEQHQPLPAQPVDYATIEHWFLTKLQSFGVPIAEIRLDMHLTELNVDSLKMIALKSEIEDTFGIRIQAADLFNTPNLAGLATYVLEQCGTASSMPLADHASSAYDDTSSLRDPTAKLQAGRDRLQRQRLRRTEPTV